MVTGNGKCPSAVLDQAKNEPASQHGLSPWEGRVTARTRAGLADLGSESLGDMLRHSM